MVVGGADALATHNTKGERYLTYLVDGDNTDRPTLFGIPGLVEVKFQVHNFVHSPGMTAFFFQASSLNEDDAFGFRIVPDRRRYLS